MTYPHNHKTVLVLDRCPLFLKSSEQNIDFDVINKARTPGIIPMAPLAKSLWTCNVEACMEFCRIVFDIYPVQKLLRFVVGDTTSKVLNTWDQNQQNIQHLMATLAQTPVHTDAGSWKQDGAAKESGDVHLVNGLTDAVRALCDVSATQREKLEKQGGEADELKNNGRIVCLTHLRSAAHLQSLEEFIDNLIQQTNKLVEDKEDMLPIDHCEVVFMHIVPVTHTPLLSPQLIRPISSVLSSELRCSQSGNFIANKMLELCTHYYHMCSTTVTGIPMKEEQNASSSANYDVELLHPADAHDHLFLSAKCAENPPIDNEEIDDDLLQLATSLGYELTDCNETLPLNPTAKRRPGCAEGLVIPSKEGLYTSTVTLKWCTPKTNIVELQQCTGAFRFTPVDINSRPSSCLTNFLLNGRSVMLEQPRKVGTRVVSHMLTSHGGELFIHVLATSRCTLEDPPSISEGCGGRLTDYRIKDFAQLMKENRLAPGPIDSASESPHIDKAKTELERLTRVWPLTLSDTILFNMLSHLDPLPSLITSKALTDEEMLECKKAIYYLVEMESRNEALPTQQAVKGKGPRREEQYRQVWAELEKLVRAYAESSANHKAVLECLLECKKPDDSQTSVTSPDQDAKPSAHALDVSLKEYDRYQNMTEREKLEFNRMDTKPPDSPPAKRVKAESIFPKGKGPTNLLALWTGVKTAYLDSRCNEFSGRIEYGNKAQLYKKFFEEKNSGSADVPPNIKQEKVKLK